VAGRTGRCLGEEQDTRDVRGILGRMGNDLDREYLDARVRDLAQALERPEILQNYERWLRA
jgi:hypothetical protein